MKAEETKTYQENSDKRSSYVVTLPADEQGLGNSSKPQTLLEGSRTNARKTFLAGYQHCGKYSNKLFLILNNPVPLQTF